MRFTPGPWFAVPRITCISISTIPEGQAQSAGYLADVNPTGKGMALFACGEETKANARLIAAAPKLFEQLESAAIVLRQHGIDTTEIDAVLAEVKGEKS